MSFRAWGPKQNLIYALSVANAQITATTPVGFNKGGNQVKIANSGTTAVFIVFYKNADGAPTLTFPVSGTPPVGEGSSLSPVDGQTCATIVLGGQEKQISIPIGCDSFAAFGAAAGPSIIYVQRGDGSV